MWVECQCRSTVGGERAPCNRLTFIAKRSFLDTQGAIQYRNIIIAKYGGILATYPVHAVKINVDTPGYRGSTG